MKRIKTKLTCEWCGLEQHVEVADNVHLSDEERRQVKELGCIYGTCSNCYE